MRTAAGNLCGAAEAVGSPAQDVAAPLCFPPLHAPIPQIFTQPPVVACRLAARSNPVSHAPWRHRNAAPINAGPDHPSGPWPQPLPWHRIEAVSTGESNHGDLYRRSPIPVVFFVWYEIKRARTRSLSGNVPDGIVEFPGFRGDTVSMCLCCCFVQHGAHAAQVAVRRCCINRAGKRRLTRLFRLKIRTDFSSFDNSGHETRQSVFRPVSAVRYA